MFGYLLGFGKCIPDLHCIRKCKCRDKCIQDKKGGRGSTVYSR